MLTIRRATILPLLVATALGAAACGNSDVKEAQDLGKDLQKQGQALQDKAQEGREEIKQISADIQSGKISPEEGQKQIEKITDELQSDAKDITKKGIEGVQNLDNVPDSAKDDLEDAKAQLEQAGK